MICIFKTIIGYFIIMFAGSNLLGLVVRGLVQPSQKIDTESTLESEDIAKPTCVIMTIIFSLLVLLYYYALYHFWNIGVVIAAAMVMFPRIPDLLFEIETGKKTTLKTMRKNPLDIFCSITVWIALPVLWYSLCYLN